MAIFDLSDLAVYAPELSLTEAQLTAAVASIQTIIESSKGANRPLELTQFTEIKSLAVIMQTAQFSYLPIAATPAPVVQTRSSGGVTYPGQRPIGTSEWATLEPNQYIIDFNGKLNLMLQSQGWARGQYMGIATQVQLTYTAGLDFTADTAEIRGLKGAIANALRYQQSQLSSGVESIRVDGDAMVRYAVIEESIKQGIGVPGALPNAMLTVFKKYRPRHW